MLIFTSNKLSDGDALHMRAALDTAKIPYETTDSGYGYQFRVVIEGLKAKPVKHLHKALMAYRKAVKT